jgi:hypothetical protein
MWYPDLSTTCQIARGPSVRAVGWLSAEHEFTKGTVARPVPPLPGYYDALRPFGSAWGYSDDVWNRLLDTEPTRIAELKRAHDEATKGKRFDWGDGH